MINRLLFFLFLICVPGNLASSYFDQVSRSIKNAEVIYSGMKRLSKTEVILIHIRVSPCSFYDIEKITVERYKYKNKKWICYSQTNDLAKSKALEFLNEISEKIGS